MARETKYTGMIGDWRKLHGLVEANVAELPTLEPFLAKLGAILEQAKEVTNRQNAMRAAKQEASKQIRTLTSQGNRLARRTLTMKRDIATTHRRGHVREKKGDETAEGDGDSGDAVERQPGPEGARRDAGYGPLRDPLLVR